ncbi:MAG: RagB/SusD family nutrient uptake outer membrane protein [Bacteroidales bacterium]|jgi:hypothetical protein|nr:RagB/SusD family nutrient uptake outer membrane protein [Bacteroidales bacterium]
MKKYSFILAASLFLLFSCDLYETPVSKTDKKAIFSSAEGLDAYSISFYNMLPDATDQSIVEQSLVDFGATTALNAFVTLNAYSSDNSSGWSWDNLRNINYFIVNCVDPEIPENTRNNYLGIARFFRALFYYDKVKRFGDVPWIDHPLEPDENALYAPRDSRELVMEKVYEDLQFACNNITRTTDAAGCSLVTSWVAYALAARVSLFEGTFRKYHKLTGLTTSAATWLKRAEDAAAYVMANSGKSLNVSYRALFTSDEPPTAETMLAICSSASLGVYNAVNWRWTSSTYGSALNLIRPFVCTYLQQDGTPYTSRAGWEYEDFYAECLNRDGRLAATIRTPGYTREGAIALPEFGGYARLGYQPIKLCVDATFSDTKGENTHAMQLFRYAEVLLNYAEAKAEQGTLTDTDWEKTVGALRKRAGITGGLTAKPTQADTYLQSAYFPDVTDPAILEIRRERSVELLLEGFRFDDLKRWKHGELMKMTWTGMYIPAINQALDVDRNGIYDVIYYTTAEELKNAQDAIGATAAADCATVQVSTDPAATTIQVHAAGNGTGYYLAWFTHNDGMKVWSDKQYFYPIPTLVMVKNPDITQNPGWENGATNNGN